MQDTQKKSCSASNFEPQCLEEKNSFSMALVSSCAGDPVSGAPWLVQSLFLRHWLPVFAENSSRQEPRVIPLRSMIIYLSDFPPPVLYENPLFISTSKNLILRRSNLLYEKTDFLQFSKYHCYERCPPLLTCDTYIS